MQSAVIILSVLLFLALLAALWKASLLSLERADSKVKSAALVECAASHASYKAECNRQRNELASERDEARREVEALRERGRCFEAELKALHDELRRWKAAEKSCKDGLYNYRAHSATLRRQITAAFDLGPERQAMSFIAKQWPEIARVAV